MKSFDLQSNSRGRSSCGQCCCFILDHLTLYCDVNFSGLKYECKWSVFVLLSDVLCHLALVSIALVQMISSRAEGHLDLQICMSALDFKYMILDPRSKYLNVKMNCFICTL